MLLFFSGGHHWQWIRPKRRGFYLFWETLLNIYLYMNLFPTSCTAFYYIDVTIGTSFLFRDYLEQRLKTLALVSCESKGRWLLRSMVEAFSSEPHSSLCLWSVFVCLFGFFLKDDDGVDVQNQYLILCEAREEHWEYLSLLYSREVMHERLYRSFVAICSVHFSLMLFV